MQYHIQQESGRKKYWICTELIYLILHIHQTLQQVISICFVHDKILLITKKIFSRRAGENLSISKSAKFYSKRINRESDKWQEVIRNHSE